MCNNLNWFIFIAETPQNECRGACDGSKIANRGKEMQWNQRGLEEDCKTIEKRLKMYSIGCLSNEGYKSAKLTSTHCNGQN